MKFIIKKNNFLRGISAAQKAVVKITTLPILEGILIEADGAEKISLTGSNLELGINDSVPAVVDEPGGIVLNAKLLSELVKELPDADIQFESGADDMVKIQCCMSEFNLKGLPAAGFPKIPDFDAEREVTLPCSTFKEALRKTIFAVSSDENRLILTGMHLHIANKTMNCVGIDGFRMALYTSAVNCNEEFKATIPAKTLVEIGKLIPSEGDIHIAISSNNACFTFGETRVTSRLLEGEFISYKAIIPNSYDTVVTLKTADLRQALERARLITASESSKIPVHIKRVNDALNISAKSSIGNVYETVNVKSTTDGDIKTAFNAHYLLSGLKAIDQEEISWNFTGAVGSAVMKAADYLYLVMPIRLSSNYESEAA